MTESASSRSFIASLSPGGKQFNVLPNESLLHAGLSAGISLPHACANGTCGDCQAKILTGTTQKLRNHDFTLSQAQKLEGFCLLCSNTATSDVHIEVSEANTVSEIPQQRLQAKQCNTDKIHNVVVVRFKFTRGKAFRFMPGQQAQINLDNGDAIILPIASCPCDSQYIEFHLVNEQTENQAFNNLLTLVTSNPNKKNRIDISGPVGFFSLSENTDKQKLFIAEGIEFAQLQGMMEQVLNLEQDIPCHLLWKSTSQTTHYRENLCRAWNDAFDEFSCTLLDDQADMITALAGFYDSNISNTEVYAGKRDDKLKVAMLEAGASPDNLYFPD